MTVPDFDSLSASAFADSATIEHKDQLFAALFQLDQWHFIARGELPDERVYIASNPAICDGEPLLKAFTSVARLHAFAREQRLADGNGEAPVLSLPVADILPTLADQAAHGVFGLHFNAGSGSTGFFVPMRQLPAIHGHLRDLKRI